MAHFTALEAHYDANLVALLQKSLRAACLGLEVVRVDTAGKLNLLELNDLLLLASFLRLLLSVEAELSIVHNTTYGGNGVRSHQNKVEALFVSETQCGIAGHNAKLLICGSDEANLFHLNVFIDEFVVFFCANGDTPPISAAMDKIAHSVKTKICGSRSIPHTKQTDSDTEDLTLSTLTRLYRGKVRAGALLHLLGYYTTLPILCQ